MPVRDRQGRFVPAGQAPPPASDRELFERMVWLLERLLWQASGSLKSFPQYRQQLQQEAQRDA